MTGKASMKFNWILWRRPRHKLGCGAKERRKKTGREKVKYLVLVPFCPHS
jgi:hypothetical protein